MMISKSNHERLKALAEDVPGLTMSGLVDELLSESIPAVEAMLKKAEELPSFVDDEEAQENEMTRILAERMVEKMFGTQEEFIHMLMKIGAGLNK